MRTKKVCTCEMWDEYFGHEKGCPMIKKAKQKKPPKKNKTFLDAFLLKRSSIDASLDRLFNGKKSKRG